MISAKRMPSGSFQISLSGPRLDAAVADAVKGQMKEIVDQGALRLEVDMSAVEFMDSSGLGALVGVLKSMGPGGQIELVNPVDAVMKVLKLTRMTKIFSIRHDAAG